MDRRRAGLMIVDRRHAGLMIVDRRRAGLMIVGRRRAGLMIVLLVLVAAVVAPRLVGRQVLGTPVAATIPGAPGIGDCLLDAPSSTHGVVSGEGKALYQNVRTGPCSGSRFGEVVAVLPQGLSAKPVRVADDDGVFSFEDPNRAVCTTAMARYLDRSAGVDVWRSSIVFESVLLQPTDLQQRFGQNWVACGVFVGGRTGAVLDYAGTVRDSLRSGLAPDASLDAIPDCLSSTSYFVQHPVDCAEPHPVEAFGQILTHHPSTTELSLGATCATVIGVATGMSDPTAAGQLQITAMAVHRASDGTFAPGLSTQDELGTATCVVISKTRQLNGSLVGLGDGPVPWARG
ncbi:hypothetical protein ABIB25_004486 [Nakamurella sp. UYEF19]|uniref:septum formation family protein n=1 Tax=Nakamurella sp. UYEF19 TaxID=1756392 RepID=UPI003398A9D0